ncbi:MAG TPA: glycosyltransferase family 87 protein, partial [Gemmataceae bacterium]|nr:glycosyltransferase family 87 protein [Gemmataceae bacterium]
PPFYALLYVPTAGLPFPISMWIWGAIGIGCLAAGLVWLRAARPGWAFLWSLTFYPVLAAVMFGQNTLLSFAVFAAVFRLLDDRRPFLAGLAAGLLWYKPQLLIGFFIWWGLMPRTHFRCWLGLIVSGLSLAALSWAVLPGASDEFVRTLRENVKYNAFAQWNVHNPKAFFGQLLPAHPELTLVLGVVCSVAGISIAWWLLWRTGGPLRVMFPVAVFLSLWASPHTLIYEWALIVAAAVVLWERLPERRDAWLTLFAMTWGVLLVSTILAQFQTEGLGMDLGFLRFRIEGGFPVVFQLSVPVLGAVGVLAARELGTVARSPVDRSRPTVDRAECTAPPEHLPTCPVERAP